MAQWQSTGGSSQRCCGFDSWQLLALSLFLYFHLITSKFIYFQCEARCSEHICTLFNYPIQVIWKRLYKTAFSKEIGTLHQLRNAINQRNVTTNQRRIFQCPWGRFHSRCCGICTWGSHENLRNGELEDDPCQQTLPLASYPGPFEKSEKRAWCPLFAHALNFPIFRESRIIPWYLRVPWCLRVHCRIFICTLLTLAVGILPCCMPYCNLEAKRER